MKRAIDRIHIINNGRYYPAREQQPHIVNYSNFSFWHIRGAVCMTAHYIEPSSFNHISVCLFFIFPAVCSAQQIQFRLLSINLRVSSDGNKSNSGTFCWWKALEQRTSASPLRLLDTISEYQTHTGQQSALQMHIRTFCKNIESLVCHWAKCMILKKQSDLEVFPECSITQKFSLSRCDKSQQGEQKLYMFTSIIFVRVTF